MRIIAVCTGNTCRSPMAEAMLKAKFGDIAEVCSRGIMSTGAGASEESILVMREMGYDISGHISQRLTQKEIETADLILTMTLNHKRIICTAVPEAKDKVFTLCEYAGIKGSIDDPYGLGINEYRKCAEKIKKAVDAIEL
ncbi:MAG: low molecular weight protein arginine phosphatase [Clostridia bacterium]|nr:low molecular weight protein arginine phosphatase [Clostridia bacterium]